MKNLFKSCLLIILNLNNIYSAEEAYVESDLSFSSQNYGVKFYNEHNATTFYHQNGDRDAQGYYVTAIIYTYEKDDRISGLKQFKGGPLHYLCLNEEEKYQSLTENLVILNNFMPHNPATSVSALSTEPFKGTETSVENLYAYIKDSDAVYITFGAGISAGYVPTLIEFFKSLNLEKVPSEDKATDDSIVNFIDRLIKEPEKVMKIVREEWTKVISCHVETTPAHEALKALIVLLKQNGKEMLVYTDNIDGIHHRSDIHISEVYIPETQIIEVIYPTKEQMSKKKIAVLICGQSFDFDGILSTINTRREITRELCFFSLNINPNSINIYDGLDVSVLSNSETENKYSISHFPIKNLDAKYLLGTLDKTLDLLLKNFN